MKEHAINDDNVAQELLFTEYDAGWRRELPVTLLTYPDGSQDLHRQTGADFKAALARAVEMLAERGLSVDIDSGMIAATGVYMTVKPAPAPATT